MGAGGDAIDIGGDGAGASEFVGGRARSAQIGARRLRGRVFAAICAASSSAATLVGRSRKLASSTVMSASPLGCERLFTGALELGADPLDDLAERPEGVAA